MAALLRISDLHVFYGPIAALRGVGLEVHQGEIVTIVGANGAGKSTLLQTISGLLRPRHGSVEYDGHPITKRGPHDIVSRGIVHVKEGRGILQRMSVHENLLMGAYQRRDSDVTHDLQSVMDRFPWLKERRHQPGGSLSGGEQQMLAIARALMGRPRLLLMDEPSLGLAPLIVREVFDIVAELKRQGITILLVEQNARQALKVADRAYVLETGKVVMQGAAADLLNEEMIVNAYLGKHRAS